MLNRRENSLNYGLRRRRSEPIWMDESVVARSQRENRIAVGFCVGRSHGEGYGILTGACKPTRSLLVHGRVGCDDAYDGMGIAIESWLAVLGWVIDQQVHRVGESAPNALVARPGEECAGIWIHNSTDRVNNNQRTHYDIVIKLH